MIEFIQEVDPVHREIEGGEILLHLAPGFRYKVIIKRLADVNMSCKSFRFTLNPAWRVLPGGHAEKMCNGLKKVVNVYSLFRSNGPAGAACRVVSNRKLFKIQINFNGNLHGQHGEIFADR